MQERLDEYQDLSKNTQLIKKVNNSIGIYETFLNFPVQERPLVAFSQEANRAKELAPSSLVTLRNVRECFVSLRCALSTADRDDSSSLSFTSSAMALALEEE